MTHRDPAGADRRHTECVASPTRRLADGRIAELRFSGDPGLTLVVDGTPQSHVDPDDPSFLQFEYVRRIGHVIDRLTPGPLTALHLGAGALTLPRYIAHTRRGSRQQVIEIDRDLVDFVREFLPLAGGSIRVRYGDAREQLGRLPAGLAGASDLVIVDIFSGATTPPHVTTVEFHELIRPLLAPTGLVVVNIADGTHLRFARGQLATLGEVYPHIAAIADPGTLKGRRFGNIVGLASHAPLALDGLQRALASDPLPSAYLDDADSRRFAASASPARDASATGSPEPPRSLFGG